jgi:hypothetical protein
MLPVTSHILSGVLNLFVLCVQSGNITSGLLIQKLEILVNRFRAFGSIDRTTLALEAYCAAIALQSSLKAGIASPLHHIVQVLRNHLDAHIP